MRDVLTQEHIDFYQQNGFVQVNDVLAPSEVTELATAMEEAMEAPETELAVRNGERTSAYYRVLNQKVNAWRDHGGVAKFSCSGQLADMARRLAGVSGIRMFHDHILWKMPGDSKPTPWHQDMPYWPMEEPKALSLWLTVDDVDEQNGCMMFVPKSHEAGKLKAISLVEPEDIFSFASHSKASTNKPIIAPLHAGSCTFHSGLTFHYAHANQTDKARRVLAIIYMPDGTIYTGKSHLITDGKGLRTGEPFRGGLFPRLA